MKNYNVLTEVGILVTGLSAESLIAAGECECFGGLHEQSESQKNRDYFDVAIVERGADSDSGSDAGCCA